MPVGRHLLPFPRRNGVGLVELLNHLRELGRRDVGKVILGVVVTKVTYDKLEMKDEEIEKVLDIPIIGKISYDDNVRKSLKMKYPVLYTHPKSKASKDYRLLATKILGDKYDYDIEPNWFYRFLRKLGLRVNRG